MDRADAISAKRKARRLKCQMFTRQQANRSLVLVRRILQDAVRGYQVILTLQKRLQRLARQGRRAQLEAVQSEYQTAANRLNAYIEELSRVGCELKDLEIGVVSFPAVHRGQEIRLCWQLGEDKVTHYHAATESFINRQPLPAGFK